MAVQNNTRIVGGVKFDAEKVNDAQAKEIVNQIKMGFVRNAIANFQKASKEIENAITGKDK